MHTAILSHSILVQACLTCRHPRAAGPSSCTSSAESLTVSWLLAPAAASTFCRVTCVQQWEVLASQFSKTQMTALSMSAVGSLQGTSAGSMEAVPEQQLQACLHNWLDSAHLECPAGIKAHPQLGCYKAQIPACHVRGNA